VDEGNSENVCPGVHLRHATPKGIVNSLNGAAILTAFTGHAGFERLFAEESCEGVETSPAISLAISPVGSLKTG
jgi:hypothetical protein